MGFLPARSHPFVYFPFFYTLKGTVEGRPLAISLAMCRDEMWENCKALWSLWVPMQVRCVRGRRRRGVRVHAPYSTLHTPVCFGSRKEASKVAAGCFPTSKASGSMESVELWTPKLRAKP